MACLTSRGKLLNSLERKHYTSIILAPNNIKLFSCLLYNAALLAYAMASIMSQPLRRCHMIIEENLRSNYVHQTIKRTGNL
jgi:hypothetical protein